MKFLVVASKSSQHSAKDSSETCTKEFIRKIFFMVFNMSYLLNKYCFAF